MDNDIKRIGIVANCSKPDAASVLHQLSDKCNRLGLTLVTCDETHTLLPHSTRVPPEDLGHHIDFLMAFGGDGTMLHAVRTLGESTIPILGVNLGSLGFMTSVTEAELDRAVDVLLEGSYTLSSRTLAACTVTPASGDSHSYTALNDLVIGWGSTTRVVTLKVDIDDAYVTSYVCDGLIVSTPTGSTGHNLSAGGPILHPETPAFVLNIICPHTLSTRPLIVPDASTVHVLVEHADKELLLSVDGQDKARVNQGDRLEIKRHRQAVRFIHLPGYDYFSVLRKKLRWSGSSIS